MGNAPVEEAVPIAAAGGAEGRSAIQPARVRPLAQRRARERSPNHFGQEVCLGALPFGALVNECQDVFPVESLRGSASHGHISESLRAAA